MIQARNFLKAAARMFRRNRRKQREQTRETPTPVSGIDPRHALTKADMTRPANKPTPALNPRHGSSPLRNLSKKQREYVHAWVADTGSPTTRTERLVKKLYADRKSTQTIAKRSVQSPQVLAAIHHLRKSKMPDLVARHRDQEVKL